jgi:hypothetical protein
LSAVEVDVFGTGSGVDADLIDSAETGETEELTTVPLIGADWTAAGGTTGGGVGTTETGETEELATVPLIEADWTAAGGAVVLRCQTNKSTDVTISTAMIPPITGKTFRRASCWTVGACASEEGWDASGGLTDSVLRIAFTFAATSCRCFSNGGVNASNQWIFPRKYLKDSVGRMFSIRRGTIVTPPSAAISTSRLICLDLFALVEKTNNNTRDDRIPLTIDSPQSAPGMISRGAIQQRTSLFSNIAQTASAAGLSSVE